MGYLEKRKCNGMRSLSIDGEQEQAQPGIERAVILSESRGVAVRPGRVKERT